MPRTILTLNADEKEWIDQVAKDQHTSMAKVIRQAIREYRQNHKSLSTTKFDKLLEKSKGIWLQEDGLHYQTKLRDEWSKKK